MARAGGPDDRRSRSAQDRLHLQLPEQVRPRRAGLELPLSARAARDHSSHQCFVQGVDVSAEVRADRKKWVKTLQRLECVDSGSYAAMLEGLKDVS